MKTVKAWAIVDSGPTTSESGRYWIFETKRDAEEFAVSDTKIVHVEIRKIKRKKKC